MYNKKLLLTALKNLDKAKKPAKKKDIDYNSKMGYRKDSPFRKKASMDIYTENGTIDMSETDRDILANGRVLPAYSGMHQFNTNVVNETPLEEARYGRSGNLNATNRLLVKNPLLKKNKLFKDNPLYKKKSYKRKIYDPSAMYFQDGGSSDNDSSKSIVAKPSWYQEPIVNPAAYVSGFRGGNPNMYKYGFLTTDRGNIVGGGGLGFPKSGIELSGLGVVPTSSDERQYFKGFYDAKISKDINKNINLGLGAGAAITGYPGDNGFVMDPIQLQPNVSLKYKFEDGGYIETELTPEEIDEYRKGGYIVEDISIPSLNKFAPGGANKGCPSGQYWNGTKCTKLYTLKNDKKYIDGVANWAMHASDPNMISGNYNDQIKDRLYSGKWGFDPESGALVRLDKIQPQSVTTLDAKTKAAREKEKKEQTAQRIKWDSQDTYRQSIIDAGFDPATFGKAKGVNTITGEPIYASSKEEADRINQEAINQAAIEGHAAVVNNPVFKAGAYMTPVGMAIGAMEGLARFVPDAATFAQDPTLANAGQLGIDVAQVLPFAKPIATATGKAFNYVKNLEPAAPGPMMLMGRFADDVAKTGDDVAKVVSKAETPKSNFKSEIDWENWVKNKEDVVNNPDIIKELNTIEETTKANGTWMKNSDGTPFKGSPEQFVVQQSSRYKTAYPEGTDVVHRGIHKNSAPTSGTDQSSVVFTGDAPTAAQYIGHIDDVKRPLIKGLNENPLESPQNIITKYYDDAKNWTNQDPAETIQKEIFDAGKNLDDEVLGLYTPKTDNKIIIEGTESPGFNRAFNRLNVEKELGLNNNTLGQKEELQKFTNWMQENFPDRNLSDNVMTDHFAKYLNEGNSGLQRVDFNNITDPNILGNVQAMKVGPGNYLKSIRGNILFDMTNPDIYKAIIPTVGVAGTATMLANPFQDSDGLQQQQYGGALSKFIGGGSPCDDGYTYDPKLGCIPMSEESMTEAQQWMTNWYKNRTIEFPEDQKGFKKANEKVLPAYNPESPMFKQMESFPVYEPIPEEYMEEDPGGYPPAGMYDGEGKVPTIYFSPDLNDEQKTDTEIHELTNHFMRRSKELYPMYDKIVKENIIPFDKTWPKEKQEFYDYIINPEEQNIQSYLNVARKKFNLKPDEVVTPERLNKMREEAKKKGLLEEGGKNFNPDIFLLFRTAKDDESLMRLFNLIAKNDSNKDEIQYGQYGGTLELGDEIELTKEQVAELKKYGYTLEQI